MVQLRSYYSLCPLIERKSFLGVSEDNETACGIVTLGKNVVTRYKFSDQKQIGGWTSKDHISAAVLYDTGEQKYVGVFNENVIKVWDSDVNTLDKLKKNKFSKPILKLIRDNEGNCSIVFKDGDCAALTYALLARKNLDPINVIEQGQNIIDVAIFSLQETKYISYICKDNDHQYYILTCELNTDINTPLLETLTKLHVKREELVGGKVVGVTISSCAEPPQAHFLWSDGRLYANDLTKDTFALVGHVTGLSSDVEVSLSWMGGKHIALYGADSAQEGAVLAVFNVLFGVGSCSHPLKLFCKGARLWCLPEYILLEAAQHLAVVPYILSSHRNTLSLIGSYKNDEVNNEILTADWGKGKSTWKCKGLWKELAEKGMSEREICLEYFPSLLENNEIHLIKKSIKDFKDIPETVIVNLISFVIKQLNSETPIEASGFELTNENLELCQLLNSILNLPYVRGNILSSLRANLAFKDMLFLLQYISFLLFDKSENLAFNFDYEQKIILWSSTLIDSFYQQLILSSDQNTQDIISELISIVSDLINQVESIETVTPLLYSICSGKHIESNASIDDTSSYYIEEIKIKGF